MIEVKGNLWDFDADLRVITTNGAVKSNGACVMGRGCAREARDKFPGIDLVLGTRIKEFGNYVHYLNIDPGLISFPVKHHWKQQADLSLIERSAKELKMLIDNLAGGESMKVVLPRPGCGNGNRDWSEVKPILDKYLDDRFYVITF